MSQLAAPVPCAAQAPPKAVAHGERRTLIVIAISAAMMVLELIVGRLTNSLALTADGWHMGTHVGALTVTAFAYWYARTRAGRPEFVFGTGKVYPLAGYTSAAVLVAIALEMGVESVQRFFSPEAVSFDQALPVAIIGLVVNLLSAILLHQGGHGHDHDHHHHDHDHSHHDHGHDQNLKAAYLHVVADAVTSLLAIGSLVVGRALSVQWLDAVVALVGAAVILRWGVGLLRDTAKQLIDYSPPSVFRERIEKALTDAVEGTRVIDLHLWRSGPEVLVCMASVSTPKTDALETYKSAALAAAPIQHLTVELRPV
jgi:cation diffusion facilitator family transporter